MAKLFAVMFISIFLLSPIASSAPYRRCFSDVYVSGYTRSDGTYVRPHYRSANNGYSCDNYGSWDYDNGGDNFSGCGRCRW